MVRQVSATISNRKLYSCNEKSLKQGIFDPLGRPQSWPVLIIVFAQVVRPSVPTFQNLAKQNKIQAKTMFTTGETVGLAEWIIDNTCLVYLIGC